MSQPVHMKDGYNYSGYNISGGGGDSGEVISYADWLLLTPEQKENGDYYVYDYNGSLAPIGGFDTVPTLGSINPVTSNGIASNIDSITTNINTVELTTTAANAHSVGEYFILIGQFVKCTQAISVGDTIAIGTNVEATSIGAVLSQLNSKIGNTDISSIGSTITGAINNLSRARLVHEVSPSSNRTYGDALGILYSYYAQLTDEEKLCSVLRFGKAIYSLRDYDEGEFIYCSSSTTGIVVFLRVVLYASKWDGTTLNHDSSGNTTTQYSEYSSNVQGADIALFVM